MSGWETGCGEFSLSACDGEDVMNKQIIRDGVLKALAMLTPREEKVLRMRFGIGNDKRSTLQEVADHFGVSRQWIFLIQAKAFYKLRHSSRSRQLKELI